MPPSTTPIMGDITEEMVWEASPYESMELSAKFDKQKWRLCGSRCERNGAAWFETLSGEATGKTWNICQRNTVNFKNWSLVYLSQWVGTLVVGTQPSCVETMLSVVKRTLWLHVIRVICVIVGEWTQTIGLFTPGCGSWWISWKQEWSCLAKYVHSVLTKQCWQGRWKIMWIEQPAKLAAPVKSSDTLWQIAEVTYSHELKTRQTLNKRTVQERSQMLGAVSSASPAELCSTISASVISMNQMSIILLIIYQKQCLYRC